MFYTVPAASKTSCDGKAENSARLIGRIWRDMRLYTIGAGTSEIMKEIFAKQERW